MQGYGGEWTRNWFTEEKSRPNLFIQTNFTYLMFRQEVSQKMKIMQWMKKFKKSLMCLMRNLTHLMKQWHNQPKCLDFLRKCSMVQ